MPANIQELNRLTKQLRGIADNNYWARPKEVLKVRQKDGRMYEWRYVNPNSQRAQKAKARWKKEERQWIAFIVLRNLLKKNKMDMIKNFVLKVVEIHTTAWRKNLHKALVSKVRQLIIGLKIIINLFLEIKAQAHNFVHILI